MKNPGKMKVDRRMMVKLISGTGAKSVARDSMEQQSLKSTMKKCTVSSIIYDMAIVSFKQAQLFQDELR